MPVTKYIMKHYIFRLMLCTATLFIMNSCNSQSKPADSKSNSTNSAKVKSSSSNYTEGKDYIEFVRARVLDKVGFSQPVEALSLLIPKNWKYEGNIMWNQPGTL